MVPRGFEGDKIRVHFQTLLADALESSLLLLLVLYSWSSTRSGSILLPPPLGRGIQHGTTNQEGSDLAFSFNLLSFLTCKTPSDGSFPIPVAMCHCDCGGGREEGGASHFVCSWLVIMLISTTRSTGINP